jgi:outer membrane biosynthesis protein TonB
VRQAAGAKSKMSPIYKELIDNLANDPTYDPASEPLPIVNDSAPTGRGRGRGRGRVRVRGRGHGRGGGHAAAAPDPTIAPADDPTIAPADDPTIVSADNPTTAEKPKRPRPRPKPKPKMPPAPEPEPNTDDVRASSDVPLGAKETGDCEPTGVEDITAEDRRGAAQRGAKSTGTAAGKGKAKAVGQGAVDVAVKTGTRAAGPKKTASKSKVSSFNLYGERH